MLLPPQLPALRRHPERSEGSLYFVLAVVLSKTHPKLVISAESGAPAAVGEKPASLPNRSLAKTAVAVASEVGAGFSPHIKSP